MKHKHLLFEERIIIEESLDKGISVHKIAIKLGRPDSSIIREIKRNRYITSRTESMPCVHRMHCNVFHLCDDECKQSCAGCYIGCRASKCNEYVAITCQHLLKSPFVCNGCSRCTALNAKVLKYKYQARRAQIEYEKTLKTSRMGITLTQEEMHDLDNLVSPLLLQGQSVAAIYMSHRAEIPCSESTLYDYIDKSYLTARNIDLSHRVKYKKRYNHGNRSKILLDFLFERTYTDFKSFMNHNPDVNIWEMDTVIGTEGGKCLLTLLYRKSTFMIAVLLEKNTQECVINALNIISNTIGIKEFQRLFQVILTDRGTEFSNPYAMECDEFGELKTKIYYCDSYCSWQKGMIEKNHEFIRMILPKGRSFDHLSQKDILLMMNHVNNYPRASLNEVSPYELSKLLLGKPFLEKLHFHKIYPDDVILKPMLLIQSKFNY